MNSIHEIFPMHSGPIFIIVDTTSFGSACDTNSVEKREIHSQKKKKINKNVKLTL